MRAVVRDYYFPILWIDWQRGGRYWGMDILPVGLASLKSKANRLNLKGFVAGMQADLSQAFPLGDQSVSCVAAHFSVYTLQEEKDLYRIVRTLSPEIRRRVFLVLVGDEFKSGEGTQAFSMLADLVVHSGDAANAERLVAQTMIERRRVYQTFWDAEDRKAEGKL